MATTLLCLSRVAARTLIGRGETLKVVLAPTVLRLQKQVRDKHDQHIDFSKVDTQYLDESTLTDYEISKDPKEWQFVERILPLKLTPLPPKYDKPSPSGWVSPREEAKNLSYFIPRNKSHLQPVYLNLSYRNNRKLTVVKRVQGNIWQAEEDLRKYLESKVTSLIKIIPTKVNELSATITIKGDHVAHVKQWMDMKGF